MTQQIEGLIGWSLITNDILQQQKLLIATNEYYLQGELVLYYNLFFFFQNLPEFNGIQSRSVNLSDLKMGGA